MKSEPLHRILIIDDNPAIHEDFRKILKGGSAAESELAGAEEALFGQAHPITANSGFDLDSAFQGQNGLQLVQQSLEQGRPYALAFVDVRMPPGWDGIETISRIWAVYPEIQIVICTAYADYSWDDITRSLGRSDSLVILKKPFDNAEVLQLTHALTEKWSLARQVERKMKHLYQIMAQRNDELSRSDERFTKTFKASPLASALIDLKNQTFLDVNRAFSDLVDFAPEDLIGAPLFDKPIWQHPDARAQLERLLQRQSPSPDPPTPCPLAAKSGQPCLALLTGEYFEFSSGPSLLLMCQDISERAELEDRLRQAVKMEAVGQLAAGLAHDFNNLLTIIHGHAELLGEPDANSELSLSRIKEAAHRATLLTQQLLTFGRKHDPQFSTIDLNSLVRGVVQMLDRLLGETIDLRLNLADPIPGIEADQSMIEQIIVNLAVNARDAMPNGGKLAIATRLCELDAAHASAQSHARPGQFVCLEISDNGSGIDSATLPRIFEPFFTTKPLGKSTGLGLATVQRIVKQHHGWIEVTSQTGVGTSFRAFLPPSKLTPAAIPSVLSSQPAKSQGQNETILVVEDESALLDLVSRVLRDSGYQVLQASSGKEALDLWNGRSPNVDLLLTDLVMPGGISGWDLADRLKASKPGLKVVYTSGYSSELLNRNAAPALEPFFFLPKPYHPAALTQMVRDSLQGTPATFSTSA